jgi:hypothetical protein
LLHYRLLLIKSTIANKPVIEKTLSNPAIPFSSLFGISGPDAKESVPNINLWSNALFPLSPL